MSLAICIFLEKLSNVVNTATCRIPSTKVLSYLTSWSFSNPLSRRLYAIRYFIQDIARFMKPVPLYFHLFPDFPPQHSEIRAVRHISVYAHSPMSVIIQLMPMFLHELLDFAFQCCHKHLPCRFPT